jgi:glycosyltransferase involved in cell wall biosynthesis
LPDTPLVTVLTTVYNGEPYFDRAVPGILAQTLEDFEFIIIDDGSDDGTPTLLDRLEKTEPRVRVLRPGKLGFSRALNYGLSLARGRYIARQDFDDVSYPERLARQVQVLEADPAVGLVGGWYVVVDENRGERYIRKQPTDHTLLVRTMAKAIPFAHTLVTLRREALVAAGGIAEVRNITDLRTWIRVAKLGWKLANVPEVLGEHYVHAESHFHQAMRYHRRQRELAWVQAQAVISLGLPPWMLAYPMARLLYAVLPDRAKRFARRVLAGSREEDVQVSEEWE